MAEKPLFVGIKYCGGCRLGYDRKAAVEWVTRECEGEASFAPVQEQVAYDYLLVLNGCPTQCADISRLRSKYGRVSIYRAEDVRQAAEEIRRIESEKARTEPNSV